MFKNSKLVTPIIHNTMIMENKSNQELVIGDKKRRLIENKILNSNLITQRIAIDEKLCETPQPISNPKHEIPFLMVGPSCQAH